MSYLPEISELKAKLTSFEGWAEAARQCGHMQGEVLKVIRDDAKYALHYTTWEECVKCEFGYTVKHADDLITHVEIVKQLAMDVKLLYSHTRLLRALPEEQRRTIVEEVDSESNVTAANLKAAIAKWKAERDQTLLEGDSDDPDEPEPAEEVAKLHNKRIDSVCRTLTKDLKELPEDEWLEHQNIKASAMSQVKAACKTLKLAKTEVCPQCAGGGCTECHMTGRMPEIVKKQLAGTGNE